MRIVLAGGGTAGHIEPALNVADALRRADPDVQILVIGSERGLESTLVPARGYDLVSVPAVPLPRRPSLDTAQDDRGAQGQGTRRGVVEPVAAEVPRR